MMPIKSALMGALMLAGAAVGAQAQSSPCLTQPDSASKFARLTSGIFRFADSTTAVTAGHPWARSANIQLVTDSTTCAAAVAAYNQLGASGTPLEATAAYVFAIGSTGYALARPGLLSPHGNIPILLFTLSWTYIATAET